MRGINCTALWIKALYKCSPFTIALLSCADLIAATPGIEPPTLTATLQAAPKLSF